MFLPMKPASEFYIDERCYVVELLNSEADPALSIARIRVLPGVTTRWHRLRGTAERYVIQSGRGSAQIGDLPPHEVGPGDAVLIPAGVRQRITNIGAEDLIFLAVCTPRFGFEAYEDVDPEPSAV